MIASDIALQRMVNQGLAHQPFGNPQDVVAWLGAMQSQDYAGAKWAIAQRAKGITDAALDQAFADGTILRTHLMRPTWHFVTPADIYWMLALTAPRVHMTNAYYYRKCELDDALFKQSSAIFVKALEGGHQLTRQELASLLQQAGIATNDLRLVYIVMHAELDGIICSGARRGKQFTYALLDERVPPANMLAHEEALAELTKRYFQSHGPATLKDYVWWSGLTVADAKVGIELIESQLEQEVIADQMYWFATSIPLSHPPVSEPATRKSSPTVYLLPNYDEALGSYKDHNVSVNARYASKWDEGNPIFAHYLVIEGQIEGTWKRTFAKGKALVEIKPFRELNDTEGQAVAAAVQQYSEFLEIPAVLQI